MKKLLVLLCVIFLVFVGVAESAVLTFDDMADFLTATGATPTDPLPNVGLIPSGSLTVGDLTFTITSPSYELFSGSIDRGFDSWTDLIPGNQIAISDIENLNVDLVNPVYSLGFEIVEQDIYNPNGISTGVSSIDSNFAVTLLNDGAFIDAFTFNAPDDVAAFVGVWGDSAFDRVEIREIDGDIKDEYFGQFYTGTTPVPEPTTLLLLGFGLIGLVGIRRKKKK